MAAPSEVVGKVNVLSKKKTALNKSEIMEPNKSKFNKCDFFFLSLQFMLGGSHCGSLPQASRNLAT